MLRLGFGHHPPIFRQYRHRGNPFHPARNNRKLFAILLRRKKVRKNKRYGFDRMMLVDFYFIFWYWKKNNFFKFLFCFEVKTKNQILIKVKNSFFRGTLKKLFFENNKILRRNKAHYLFHHLK